MDSVLQGDDEKLARPDRFNEACAKEKPVSV
jgi:hypothetical protein